MNTKKTVSIATFIFALTYANFASAVAWSPLVRIPGLPASGTVNLSMYMIGLYNFLLSIVGIVAVMMLIIGGMRYITAAGNAAAISDAKDIIQNAVVGLIIALFSWVFIATINPDALYIKQPGASFLTTTVHGVCYQSFDLGSGACVCLDPPVLPDPPTPPQADAEACEAACQDNCNLPGSKACMAQGSPHEFTDLAFTDKNSIYYGKCKCIDGELATPNWVSLGGTIPDPPTPTAITCNEVCSDWTLDSNNEYHGVNWDLRIGPTTDSVTSVRGENYTATLNEPVYFDFSHIKDCNDGLVHFAMSWTGPPLIPDEWCCMNMDPNCSSTWGDCCNGGGTGCPLLVPLVPYCNTLDGSHLFDSPSFPIYAHTFIVATPEDDPEDVWVGVSIKKDITCGPPVDPVNSCLCHDNSLEKEFQIIVE